MHQRARMTEVEMYHSLRVIILFAILLSSCASQPKHIQFISARDEIRTVEDISDETLQKAAAEALGEREGTVIVIDPQTGRLRAVVNPRVAFEQIYPPGSAIKPFTALAALRAGLLDLETKRQCETTYTRGDF